MNELEQNLMFAVAGIVLLGTLIVFVWQYVRMRRNERDDRGDAGGPGDDQG